MSRRSEFKEKADSVLDELKRSKKKPKLLLHACCAPCSTYCLEYLAEYFDITVFYYNPNMDSIEEYRRRGLELERLIQEMNPNISLLIGSYDAKIYSKVVIGFESEPEGQRRCERCFRLRLAKSAQIAKEIGCDYFTTTLTISPHKNAAVINKIGEEIARETGIPWFPSDFKKNGGFQRSIELSAKYDLYRQDYCGCVYSIRNDKQDSSENILTI